MPQRCIKRIAFLQEYRNRPWTMKEMIPEAAAKGYQAAAFYVRIGQEKFFADLAREAAVAGLEAMAFTGFMKYDEAWLKDHPDHRVMLSSNAGAKDQDRLAVNWGCPHNPDFLARYLTFLRTISANPNVTEVWINDEAFLGFAEDKLGCYCPVCEAEWKKEFGGKIPMPPFTDSRSKVALIRWRFRRWNAVHAQMKAVLNEQRPVRAVFLTSPACCIWLNSWVTAVDLAGMARAVDGIMTDPYYTFHLADDARGFMPREVYLSEMCRYLRGMAGDDAQAEICAQGFSQSTFTRPMGEEDGWWAGVVPAALGIDSITAYTYALQKISPMQKSYEASFRFDSHFARTRPVEFAGVVDSLETKCFHLNAVDGATTWQRSRMLPVADALRHHALPYTYVPSHRLEGADLGRWPVLILPGVTCLSAAAKDRLREYAAAGGVLVALGETATRDETGQATDDPFMEEVFGVRSQTPGEAAREFVGGKGVPAFSKIPWPDEVTGRYMEGTYYPALAFAHPVVAETAADVETLAAFKPDSAGAASAAITRRTFGHGQALYCAGIPAANFLRPEFQSTVLNHAGRALALLIGDLAEDKLPLRAKGFPPHVPMQDVRPIEARTIPTVEFMPSVGPDLYLAVVTSYFKEPMAFQIEAVLPKGRTCSGVRELVADQAVHDVRRRDGRIEIDVALGFNDCIKVYAFFLK